MLWGYFNGARYRTILEIKPVRWGLFHIFLLWNYFLSSDFCFLRTKNYKNAFTCCYLVIVANLIKVFTRTQSITTENSWVIFRIAIKAHRDSPNKKKVCYKSNQLKVYSELKATTEFPQSSSVDDLFYEEKCFCRPLREGSWSRTLSGIFNWQEDGFGREVDQRRKIYCSPCQAMICFQIQEIFSLHVPSRCAWERHDTHRLAMAASATDSLQKTLPRPR